MMTIEIIDTLDGLRAIAEPWDRFALKQNNRLPMSSWAWVASHIEYLLPRGMRWLCLAGFDDAGLVGVWPLVFTTEADAGHAVLKTPAHPHTLSVDAVLRPDADKAVILEFVETIDRVLPGWRAIELSRLEDRSPSTELPIGYGRKMVVTRSKFGYASVVDTRGDFDVHLESLSRNFRKRLRRSRRRLLDLVKPRLEFITTGTESAEHFERFTSVEAAGWKGQAGSAVRSDEVLCGFYEALAARMARRGALEWHFLSVDGNTIAGHMAFRAGRSLFIWKIGYDEEYSRFSPGVLLMEDALRRAFESPDIDEVNLVTDRDWHDHWHPAKRTYWDMWIYPYRLHSIVTGAWPKQARIALRSIPGLKALVDRVRGQRGGE